MLVKQKASIVAMTIATIALLITGNGSAYASTDSRSSTAIAAESVFNSVYHASDPAATLAGLSPDDRKLFDLWTTVTPTVTSVVETKKSTADVSAAACSSYTQRGSFTNQVGAKLGEFWTTGEGCRTGNSVTSVSFVDGGGKTSALGWRYTGKTTGKNISGNVGKVYGAYTFKLNIAGVDVQQPTYCARVVHTLGAAYGDLKCGLS